ncbi:hypothetical protein GKQ38_04110 [Candidatus Nanohaloarchaea archaeon]|nr:hypothetical protein GKQ38_04110 [Candidatus Nanohaloarchaea archaeon]
MRRGEKVLEQAQSMIDNGRKPSATVLSQELGWPENDVHRCLNSLEKKGKIETYTKAFMGRKHRLIGVKR